MELPSDIETLRHLRDITYQHVRDWEQSILEVEMLCEDLDLAHELGPEAADREWPNRINRITPPPIPYEVAPFVFDKSAEGYDELAARLPELNKNHEAAMDTCLNKRASAKEKSDAAALSIPYRRLIRDQFHQFYLVVSEAILDKSTNRGSRERRKSVGKRGRPPVEDNSAEENRIWDAWHSGQYYKHVDCDLALGLDEGTTHATVDRLRKRQGRRKAADTNRE